MNKLDHDDLVWLAGFMDGEGSFQISRKQIKERANENYQVQVSVTNTNYNAMAWIRYVTSCGNWLILDRIGPKCKTAYRLTWYGINARSLAEQLLPYLKVKKEAASVMLQMPLGKRWENRMAEQRESYDKLKIVNQRGSGQ